MNVKGLATGIGSLPLVDAGEAVKLVFRCVPHIPFWPQLPRLNAREGMVAQFSENLPGLKMDPGGLRFAPEDREKELEEFYEKLIFRDVDYFEISRDFASGLYAFDEYLERADLSAVKFLKCQVTGPFSFSSAINNAEGKVILHDKVLMQAMAKGLGMKALWQVERFKRFGKKIIMFFDEPYLACVGSAYTPVDRNDVIEVFRELVEPLKGSGCLVGVHCCGNTDWSMLMEAGCIDIINFDAFEFRERFVLYAENLKDFLKKGGIVCWGIVPTQPDSELVPEQELARRIGEGVDILSAKGVDRGLICERMMISPACGLGTMGEARARDTLELLGRTAALIEKAF